MWITECFFYAYWKVVPCHSSCSDIRLMSRWYFASFVLGDLDFFLSFSLLLVACLRTNLLRLCASEKRRCRKTTQEVAQFQFCTLPALSVRIWNARPCFASIHKRLRKGFPLQRERRVEVEVGVGWAVNCSFRRRTTSKRSFLCPWRPLLSNQKPRCQN